MKKTDSKTDGRGCLQEDIRRYDLGYQSVHFHLKQQRDRMFPSQIMMAVRINGRRYRVYTKCKVEPVFWNTEKGCCRVDDLLSPRVKTRTAAINAVLAGIRKSLDVADMIAAEQNRFLSLDDLRTVIGTKRKASTWKKSPSHGKVAPARSSTLMILHGLADRFDSEISDKGTRGASSSKKNYLYCWKRLSDFISETKSPLDDFSKLDRVFYRKFTCWMNERRGYSASTVILSVNCITNLHHKAYVEGLTDVPPCRTAVIRPPSDVTGTKIYLDEDELYSLRRLTDLTAAERSVLDMFLLASYTGLRFSDICSLDEAVILEGIIRLFQKKTHGYVSIPVLKEVGSIVQKYYNTREGFPKLNHGYANKVIKDLCRRAGITDTVPIKECRGGRVIVGNKPKCELVSFHTARRSCITNLFRRGYSPNYLMTMSGHKSISSFQRYIKSSEDELASDFIRKLKKDKALLP